MPASPLRSLLLTLALTLGFALPSGATTWHDGDMVTYNQTTWGDLDADASTLLATYYATVYQSTFGVFEIGIPGVAGFSIQFTNVDDLQAYLPPAGALGSLDSDFQNPTSTSAGFFGGDVAALKLNVDFSDAGFLSGNVPLFFGDLVLHDMSTLPLLNGTTVRGFLAIVNSALGGGSALYPIEDLDLVAGELNGTFYGGAAASFAQDHLNAPVPEPGTLVLVFSGIAGIAVASRSRRG